MNNNKFDSPEYFDRRFCSDFKIAYEDGIPQTDAQYFAGVEQQYARTIDAMDAELARLENQLRCERLFWGFAVAAILGASLLLLGEMRATDSLHTSAAPSLSAPLDYEPLPVRVVGKKVYWGGE